MQTVFAIENFLPATDMLGQDDGLVSTPSPIFTKGGPNNVAHKLGLNISTVLNGVVMDTTDHRLFVSDSGNNRVLIYNLDSNNALLDRIPDNVLGQLNFWGSSAATTQAGMNVPLGIAYDDANNRLFVVQGSSTVVARLTVYDVTSITDGENAVNVLGQAIFTTAGPSNSQEGMNLPTGVAFDPINNRLFVAQNTANRVTVYDTAVINDGEPAVGLLGQTSYTASTAATTQAGMNVPYDIAFSGSALQQFIFVSQAGGHRVTTYDVTSITDGENATAVLGQTTFTTSTAASTQAGMNNPRALAYDGATKRLYVAQAVGGRHVSVFDVASISNGENAINVLGQANYANQFVTPTQSVLAAPTGLYIDSANAKLYVADTLSRVPVFDVASITDGENAVDLLGQSDDSLTSPSPVYTKGTANNAPLKNGMGAPQGVAVDGNNHRLYVADSSNNRVLVYNLDADNILIDRMPDNVLGQVNFYSNAATTTQSSLSAPNSFALDSATNRLFVSDASNNRIVVYDVTSITDGENAVSLLGNSAWNLSSTSLAPFSLSLPRQIAYDSVSGQLAVADSGNSRILIFTGSTILDGADAIAVIGQDDGTVSAPQPIFSKGGVNNAAHKLGLSAPTSGLAVDTVDHRLFLADTSNNRVLVYNLDSSNILLDRTPDFVLGQLNFYANALAVTRGGMQTPTGLAYDPTGKRLFVGQVGRVTVYDVATIVNGEDAVNILGQTNYNSNGLGFTQSGLGSVDGIAYDDATDRLFVAQSTSSNRIIIYDLAAGYNNNINADNLLGQYADSLTAPEPVFTKSTGHNGMSRWGMSAPGIGLALDSTDHRLFVSDTSNNRVLVYNLDSNNLLLDRLPDNQLGQPNYYSSTAGQTQSGLSGPSGLTFDDAGDRLFVVEASGNRVKIFNVGSITDGENAVNVIGQANFTSLGAGATQSGLTTPSDALYDAPTNRLFVSQGSRVTVYDVTTITNGENAINVLGQSNFTSTSASSSQAGLNTPTGLALSGSILFVGQNSGNRITVFDVASITDGENAIRVLGQANFTAAVAGNSQVGLFAVQGVAYDQTNKRLFATNSGINRVVIYDLAAGITNGMNAWHVLGQTTWTGTTGAATQAGLNSPQGVAYNNANGLLYVSEQNNNRVKIYDMSGSISDNQNALDVLGQTDDDLVTPGPIFTKSAAHNGPNILGLAAPGVGLALDSVNHRLFVADTTNSRVLVYNLDSNDVLLDRIPDNVLGQAVFYTNAAASTQAGMASPNGLAFDSVGNRLFVAETGNRVKIFDTASITNGENAINVLGQTTFTGVNPATTQAGMNIPTGVAYDSTGQRLFVAQGTGNRVTVYNIGDGITDGENAVNVLGQTTFTGTSPATTQAGMNVPYDVTISGSTLTTLFVSQESGHRVTAYDVTAITDGENAIKVLGQTTFTGTSPATTQAGMNAPRGISYDAANKRLYVANRLASRITVYNLGDGITDGENAANVLGSATFTANGGSITQESMSNPSGVLADGAHNRVYVADTGFNRVLSYDTQVGIGNGENAINVLGQSTFTATTAATTQAGVNFPRDVTLSGSSTLFVPQDGGHRVTVYNLADGITDGENAIKVLGQTTFTATAAATTQAGMNAARATAYNPTTKMLYVAQTGGNRVTVYNLGDGITDGENAVAVLGQANFITTTATARQAGMNVPNGLAYDAGNSRLYVLQSSGNRASVFDVASIMNGEDAIDALGQSDDDLNPPGVSYVKNTANNGPYKWGLNSPAGVAWDTINHRLLVADSTNNRVLSYNLTAGNRLVDRTPDNVLGQLNFYSNGALSTQAGLSLPSALYFNALNNQLYVSDSSNGRILFFDIASITDGENAVGLLGPESFTSGTATTQYGLSAPKQVDYDPVSGQLFVADGGNSRVMIFTVDTPPTATSGGDIFHFFGW